jgi:spore coat protein B
LKFNTEIPEDFEYKKAADFHSLLDILKFQWVKINRGGPEKIEGVLCDLNKDIVSLVNNEEIVHISLFHIRNISNGLMIEKANDEKSENQSQDSQSELKLETATDEKSENQNQDSQEKMFQSQKRSIRKRVVKNKNKQQEK